MIELSLADVAVATGGALVDGADPTATVTAGVEYDSRAVTAGGLFVALRGESEDGHRFATAAVGAGAVAAVAEERTGVPTVLVADTLVALGRIARAVVDRLPDTTVVGVTGSSGKTSTKDMIAALTARLGDTVAPVGTLNNELGHPYTVLQADRDTRYLVLECSARGIGHVAYLCEIAPPRIGVVLNVGSAHLGEFGSVEAIATAKGELVEALPADGTAVLNADDKRVRAMAQRTRARVVLFGTAPDADVRATDVALDGAGRPSFTLHAGGESVPVQLGLYGAHQVSNALATAAAALACGMPLAEVGSALGGLRPASPRRMDVFTRSDGVTVIDDSYNANLASMTAALRTLATIGAGRRTWAVLGYMAELGRFEQTQHEQVGRLAAELGVDRVVAVEPAAAGIDQGARARAADSGWEGQSVQVPDQQAAIALLADEVRPGDVVLVKGSRYRTWHVADALRETADSALGDREAPA
ncbi:UDP-N-acetylmuramoyl-tripeptide--D-alanyl-D-alanine ligase [Actinocatenispora sera]|uniref:UDP-N-acetylmuramoyl-tripeptide--D-alanyl-D-alanine ligase n=1 Tax=Actinocatenispora sera TaxID=390989 RepID=A0A810L9E3_9ACTN|nr:UDP-N-acetylmuramoyl-tripeptide--D-alanyl-D-alanine ligase [Actinocatenispora sera]BCJ30916.1 UDP-N-acetylmuramoyl-tripeptide--D-alanyl-D-alanine ligase [Actinocatenispora sera]